MFLLCSHTLYQFASPEHFILLLPIRHHLLHISEPGRWKARHAACLDLDLTDPVSSKVPNICVHIPCHSHIYRLAACCIALHQTRRDETAWSLRLVRVRDWAPGQLACHSINHVCSLSCVAVRLPLRRVIRKEFLHAVWALSSIPQDLSPHCSLHNMVGCLCNYPSWRMGCLCQTRPSLDWNFRFFSNGD